VHAAHTKQRLDQCIRNTKMPIVPNVECWMYDSVIMYDCITLALQFQDTASLWHLWFYCIGFNLKKVNSLQATISVSPKFFWATPRFWSQPLTVQHCWYSLFYAPRKDESWVNFKLLGSRRNCALSPSCLDSESRALTTILPHLSYIVSYSHIFIIITIYLCYFTVHICLYLWYILL